MPIIPALKRSSFQTHMNFTVDQFLPKIRQNDLDKKKTFPEGDREEEEEEKRERGAV